MPVLLERERPSEAQLKAVRAYIMRRREKEKRALAESKAKQEAALQRKREQQKKKETVEDVKLQINQLENKLECLKNEKHQLFLQLKKVLNEEAEQKRQKERQIAGPPFSSPHPLMAGNFHRMPYTMMGPRHYGVLVNPQTVRMDQPGGIKQPTSPSQSQGYIQPNLTQANQLPGASQSQGLLHANPGFSTNNDLSYGTGVASSNLQPDKHIAAQPQIAIPPVSTPSISSQVKTSFTPVDTHSSKLQYPQSQNPQTPSSNIYPKHEAPPQTLQSQPRDQQQMKQPVYTSYPPKPETLQQQIHHQETTKQQQQQQQQQQQTLHPKPEQMAQHKQPLQHGHPLQLDNIKPEHIPAARPQQYGAHNYHPAQQNQPSQAYPPQPSSHHAKQPAHTYPTSQTTNYSVKTNVLESDPKQSFQMPSTQPQQTYGYPIQQQQLQQQQQQAQPQQPYQVPTQPPPQVSYPPTVQQQSYQGYPSNKDQTPGYIPQQPGGYQVASQQQGYSGQQQYQSYLSQQYQAQPYHGYSTPTEHKVQPITQNYQAVPQLQQSTKSQNRTSQFEQSKHDSQMPPPPPQKPPPKPESSQTSSGAHSSHYGEHYHQHSSKRSSRRYDHPYKKEHHSSSSSKPKFSEKYSFSQDDHPGSSSSRHHYHASSKSSHSKGSSSSSHQRQSRYH